MLSVVRGLKPQLVVIDWCWSRNGDLVTSLSSFLLKLSLCLDRTFIVGHGGWVEADTEQKKFIDDVNDQQKQFKAKEYRTTAKELFGIEPYSTDIYITNPDMPKSCYFDTRETTINEVKYNKYEIGSKKKMLDPFLL